MRIPLHTSLVVCYHMFFHGSVKLRQAMEGLLTNTGIYTMIDELYLILDKGFVMLSFT